MGETGATGTWRGLESLREGLRGYLRRHCADDNEVDDVIQETFLRAARYRKRLEPRQLRPWAMRVALNVLMDFKRRNQRYVHGTTSEGALDALAAPEDTLARDDADVRLGPWILKRGEALEHLAGAFTTLREDDRQVLSSFYAGAQSSRETAEECAIPAHLVKIRLFRARRRLLSLLRRRIGDELEAEAPS